MKRTISVFLTLSLLIIVFSGILPLTVSAGYNDYINATMKSAQTVYCMPGGGMTIGSVSKNESVKVFWSDSSYYYIEYVVSSGNYSGYKRGYVPISSVNTGSQTIPSQGFTSFLAKTSASKTVYNRSNTSSMVIGTVYASDKITVLNVENNTWCYIQYPVGSSSYKRGYVLKSDIVSAEGNLEAISFSRIVGWAWNPAAPDTSIYVQIKIHNNSTGQDTTDIVCANIYRLDLLQAGKGNGYHGFSYGINWNNLPSGNYSVTATALSGFNPQVASTLTYSNSSSRTAGFYFVSYPDYSNTYQSTIDDIQDIYEDYGLTDSQSTHLYAQAAIGLLQVNTIFSIQGHGMPSVLTINCQNINQHLLTSTIPPPESDTLSRALNILPANSMNQADIVAFLSCYSAVAYEGEGHLSLTQVVLNKGAKVSVGFDGEVYGPQIWYNAFVEGLSNGCDCYGAYLYAQSYNSSYQHYSEDKQFARIYRRCMV